MVYTINMIPGQAVQVVRVSQNDTSLRRFEFRLKIRTAAYALTDETVEFIQSNGARHACEIIDGAAVLDAYSDMTEEAGLFRAKLRIEDSGGGIAYSAAFVFEVEAAA